MSHNNTESTKKLAELASETRFAGPLWLREEVGALYAKGEVHTGPFSMPLLRMANFDKLSLPSENRNLRMLDLCCGSGVTTHELQVLLQQQGLEDKVDLVCGDFSAGQLEYLDKRIQRMGWRNTVTRQMNAERNGEPDMSFDHVVCAQGLMIIPDSQAALQDCYRVLKPGGTFALSVWYTENWILDVRDAVAQLPGLPNWPQTSLELTNSWAQGPWEDPHYVKSMLHRRGFVDIDVQTKIIMIPLKDAEDFYEVYDAFIEWVADRYWTEGERKRCKPLLRDAVVGFMERKYGRGRPFSIEKVCILGTARRPGCRTERASALSDAECSPKVEFADQKYEYKIWQIEYITSVGL
ncbi:putative UbiE/COQ5 family methyltransferase [Mollisia scopiformis]|uniref:Putative UbiE/COQ5 family methyltransferase n=1 Tax=Mollisia scopiformis TaxID=149040 RepID=A0A194XET1_MOLSC|nr:putative UbiE/COQ5 family methyltransferase [Mollisia scopiformis]KUJ18651.1 putative UbiE/COQ5 family methyltransferase [Mollisia scopiformis]